MGYKIGRGLLSQLILNFIVNKISLFILINIKYCLSFYFPFIFHLFYLVVFFNKLVTNDF